MQSQHPDDTKNMMLAVALAMAVLFGWQYFYAGPEMRAQQEKMLLEKKLAEQAKSANPTATDPSAPAGTAQPGAKPALADVVPAATRDEALARSPRLAIETPSLKGSLALKGGLIDDLTLVKHHETVDPKSPNVILLSPLSGPEAYFAEYGWQAKGTAASSVPNAETVWTASTTGALTPDAPAKLTWDNGAGLVFHRTIAVDADYMFKITDEVENKTSSNVTLTPYARLYRFGKPKTTGYAVLHEGLIGVPGDAGLIEIPYATALKEPGPKSYEAKTGGWIGITDKYWASALIPDQSAPFAAVMEGRAGTAGRSELYTAEYTRPEVVVAAGQRQSIEGQLYAGAKQVKVVEAYETTHNIKLFNKLIDWGWFHFFTRPLNHLLDWLYQILGNFGVAILAVTVLVKAAFYPLANKSYESMAKMKKLQPQMEAIREKFKDDKQRQQQEVMKLYQTEKINPLAGCLPVLIQIPVFFALYKVLFISIDMRHAPFYGWIKDLSAADPTSLFNLFGLLPFTPPDFLHVGVWPILMGITMFVQMQLNPPQPDPIQQKMFSYMPLMFTFLLGSFPAGLVIYWAWNNLLSIAQQYYITQKSGAEIHLFDNMKRIFAPLARLFGRGGETKS
jgi:YidC/Oxa1 family membrane protein insertase